MVGDVQDAEFLREPSSDAMNQVGGDATTIARYDSERSRMRRSLLRFISHSRPAKPIRFAFVELKR